MEKPRKKMGRPKKYDGRDGAPMFSCRLEPQVFDHIRAQPEGPRAYVERLVTGDMDKTAATQRAQESTDPNDVPGPPVAGDRPAVRYSVRFYREGEWWMAYSPAFDAVTQGETREEAVLMAQDLLAGFVALSQERGAQLPAEVSLARGCEWVSVPTKLVDAYRPLSNSHAMGDSSSSSD